MNNNNIEIELRFRVDNESRVEKWLEQNAEKLYEKEQTDTYYTPMHRNFLKSSPIVEWLRLRDAEGDFSITYKKWRLDKNGKTTNVADEYESKITNLDLLKNILESLDFKELVVVDKEREGYKYKGCEIVLDEIEGLGTFLEIENKSNEGSNEEVKLKLQGIADEIGRLEEPDEDVKLGYPYMLLKKSGKLENLCDSETENSDKIAELAQLIDKAEDEKLQVQNQLKRALADYANLERDMERRLDISLTQSTKRAAQGIVSVLDDVQMAIQAKEDIEINDEAEAWADGLVSAMSKLRGTLEEMGIEAMNVQSGDQFDSSKHEALSVGKDDGYENNQIIKVLQDGYMLGDTVIRPARVIVNKV